MTQGKRPGGLTALAVLNFVFGGIGAIVALLAFGGLTLIKEGIAQAEASGAKYDGPGLTAAYVMILLMAVSAALLITAGVGYLKQRRFLGRTLGNAYALVSIGSSVLGIVTGGGMGIGTIIFLVYPVLTIIMLNTTFKEDLIH